MVDAIAYVIMVPMVYLALAWCAVGIVVRIRTIAKAPRHPFTLKTFPLSKAPAASAVADAFLMPTIRRTRPLFWVMLGLFHLGVALLIASHLDLLPQINLMSPDSPHMIGYGLVGLTVTVAVTYFLVRRFASPLREISVPADYLLLLILLFVFLTGDVISWGNSWSSDGFVITKQDFAIYFGHLVSFDFSNPREALYGSHYYVVVAHVLLANVFLIVLPYSKILHTFLAVPMNKLRRS